MQRGPRQVIQRLETETGIIEMYDNGDYTFINTDPNLKDSIDKDAALENENMTRMLELECTRLMLEHAGSLLRDGVGDNPSQKIYINMQDFEAAIDDAKDALDEINDLYSSNDELENETKPKRPSR